MNSKLSIMVVDDQQDFRDFLSTYLEDEGFMVFQADNGDSALQLLANQKPNLILLDIMMPDKNGYDVCRDIKANNATSDIPVIFVTAKNGLSDKLAGYIAGGQRFLCKPFDLSELDECIRVVMRHQDIKERQLEADPHYGPDDTLM